MSRVTESWPAPWPVRVGVSDPHGFPQPLLLPRPRRHRQCLLEPFWFAILWYYCDTWSDVWYAAPFLKAKQSWRSPRCWWRASGEPYKYNQALAENLSLSFFFLIWLIRMAKLLTSVVEKIKPYMYAVSNLIVCRTVSRRSIFLMVQP